MHDVVIPLIPGFQPLDVVGPHEVLAGATVLLQHAEQRPDLGYHRTLVAAEAGPVVADSGLQLIATAAWPEDGPIGTLLVPGGHGYRSRHLDPGFVNWLRRAAARAERVVSVCTGAFALAAAGLLDGYAATTHWRYAPALADRYPAVDVQVDPGRSAVRFRLRRDDAPSLPATPRRPPDHYRRHFAPTGRMQQGHLHAAHVQQGGPPALPAGTP